jgi:hypothetical protein
MGATFVDTNSIMVGEWSIMLAPWEPYIAQITAQLTSSNSIGAVKDQAFDGEKEFLDVMHDFPQQIARSIPLSEKMAINFSSREINPLTLGLAQGLNPYSEVDATYTEVSNSSTLGTYDDSYLTFEVTQVDTLTLTGTSGTAVVGAAGGLSKTATFNSDLTTTASDFVTANAAAYLAEGIVLTSSTADLIFTSSTASATFTSPTIANATGDLAGSVAHTALNNNDGPTSDRFTFVFDSATTYKCYSAIDGYIQDGSSDGDTTAVFAPNNGTLVYFSLGIGFFTGTWAADDVLVIDTTAYAAAGSGLVHGVSSGGSIGLGNVLAPEYLRCEAHFTYPSGETMYLILPRVQIKSNLSLNASVTEEAATPWTIEATAADSSISGISTTVWNNMKLGRFYWPV